MNVTREELELMTQRRGMEYLSCQGRFRDELVKKVLARPDPLEVLEKWRAYAKDNANITERSDWFDLWWEEGEFIKELRTNPDAVIARGEREGWL